MPSLTRRVSGDVISASAGITKKSSQWIVDRRLMQVGGCFVFGLLLVHEALTIYNDANRTDGYSNRPEALVTKARCANL